MQGAPLGRRTPSLTLVPAPIRRLTSPFPRSSVPQATAAEASTAVSFGRKGESKRLRERSAQLRVAAEALSNDDLETALKILGQLEGALVSKAVCDDP